MYYFFEHMLLLFLPVRLYNESTLHICLLQHCLRFEQPTKPLSFLIKLPNYRFWQFLKKKNISMDDFLSSHSSPDTTLASTSPDLLFFFLFYPFTDGILLLGIFVSPHCTQHSLFNYENFKNSGCKSSCTQSA